MSKFMKRVTQLPSFKLVPTGWTGRVAAITVFGLALSGCVSLDQMKPGLESLMGKNSKTAFTVLGYPTSKQQYGTDTVYIWSVRRSSVMMVPQTATTYGVVDNKPMYGTTTYNQAVRVVDRCRLTLVADKDDILTHYQYNGDAAACDDYIQKLKDYGKAANSQ